MSRLILALDTTNEHGSLALLRDEQLLEEVSLYAPSGFSQVLYRYLAELLDRHALKAGWIDCFAATSGPGSFTGVRVGLACVKGLAEATGKPAVAVSNLQALASFGTLSLRAVVLDARRGEVYGAVYGASPLGLPEVVSPEVVTKLAAWVETLPAGELEFISHDFTPFQASLVGTRFEHAPVRTAPRALAATVAHLALRAVAQDPAALDANYVRRSDAELLWKE